MQAKDNLGSIFVTLIQKKIVASSNSPHQKFPNKKSPIQYFTVVKFLQENPS